MSSPPTRSPHASPPSHPSHPQSSSAQQQQQQQQHYPAHSNYTYPPAPLPDDELEARARAVGDGAVLDDVDALTDHLARVHPSRYGALLDGVTHVFWRGLRPLADQNVALRTVVLADRMYDRSIPLAVSGASLADLFTPEMLAGGYRKKYSRALSRLTSLARDGA